MLLKTLKTPKVKVRSYGILKNCNFIEFEKRLLDIHSISEENYFSRLSKDKNYVMEYNEKISTIEILRKKIDSFLAL